MKILVRVILNKAKTIVFKICISYFYLGYSISTLTLLLTSMIDRSNAFKSIQNQIQQPNK